LPSPSRSIGSLYHLDDNWVLWQARAFFEIALTLIGGVWSDASLLVESRRIVSLGTKTN